MDIYFEDNTGVNLSPRDWPSLRAPDSRYSYRRDPPTLDRPTVQYRQDHPKPICSGYRDIGPDRRDYYAKPYPYQLARGDNPRHLEPFVVDSSNSYQLLLLVVMFAVVAALSFVMGAFSVAMFSGKRLTLATPSAATLG
jgi:hypothetical protein